MQRFISSLLPDIMKLGMIHWLRGNMLCSQRLKPNLVCFLQELAKGDVVLGVDRVVRYLKLLDVTREQ